MAMRKYIFAGLDFIFDKEGEPWFIEANGSPRGMRSFEMLFGKWQITSISMERIRVSWCHPKVNMRKTKRRASGYT